MTDASTRNEQIDALRALALLPVFAVNFSSFVYGFDTSSLGLTTPEGSWLAIACVWLTAALLQAKGVTLLSFLVGVSFVLSARASSRRGFGGEYFHHSQLKRLQRQTLLGIVHGALLYFGDILLSYALSGFVLLQVHRAKTRKLIKAACILFTVGWLLMLMQSLDSLHQLLEQGNAIELNEPEPAMALASTWPALWYENLRYWGLGLVSQLFVVPFMTLPVMLLGVATARLRWLTHLRWQRARKRTARRVVPFAITLNLLAATLYVYGIDQRIKEYEALAMTLMSLAAPLAIAWLLCDYSHLYSTQIIKICQHKIAPLGRYSLSSYLFGSLLMNLLFAGTALALAIDSCLLLLLAIAYWGVSVCIAHIAQRKGWQGWPERWLSVRAHQLPQQAEQKPSLPGSA